ncbi:MAG TPA: hypothetical protein ENJ41_05085 [Oceanospirillales bacterium]|nr:hypothetical protein [Oceanospirillales bacterium]
MSKKIDLTPKLKVDLVNLDSITSNTLKFFFSSNLCSYAKLKQPNQKANLIIVDYERGYDNNFIKKLVQNNQYAVVLHMAAKEPEENPRLFWLIKPMQAIQLKQNILSIQQLLIQSNAIKPIITGQKNDQQRPAQTAKMSVIKNEKNIAKKDSSHLYLAINRESSLEKQNRYKAHKHVGSNKDINPKNPHHLELIYLTPEKYLYHHLSKAIDSEGDQKDAIIETLLGNILYHNDSQKFFYTFETSNLKLIQGSPLFIDSTVTYTNLDRLSLSAKKGMNAKKLIWESAILASKGRISFGTSLDHSVDLQYWPNYPNLLVFRYVIQISAVWSRNKLSLIETAAQLGIPQRYVFTLYCAMQAIKSANVGHTNSNSQIIDESKKQSIFGKILSHIFSKSA